MDLLHEALHCQSCAEGLDLLHETLHCKSCAEGLDLLHETLHCKSCAEGLGLLHMQTASAARFPADLARRRRHRRPRQSDPFRTEAKALSEARGFGWICLLRDSRLILHLAAQSDLSTNKRLPSESLSKARISTSDHRRAVRNE